MNRCLPASPGVLHAADRLSERVASFLACATRELIQGGVQQTLVFSRDRATAPAQLAQFEPQVRMVEVERHGCWPWRFARALRAELVTHRYEAMHLHAGTTGLLGRLALDSALEHPPMFYTPHGLSNPFPRLTAGVLHRTAMLQQIQPVGCGHGEARELERLTGRAATVLEFPIDAAGFDVTREPDAQTIVLSVAEGDDPQAAQVFAELAARFCFAGEPARFRWIGCAGPDGAALLRAAGVEVLVDLDPDALRAQMAGAHVFVQTSCSDYCGGLAVARALAAGLPCVLSDSALHRELVVHAHSGLLARDLADLAQCVKQLIDQPALAGRLGEAGRLDARRRFHPHRFRNALLSLYRLGDERGGPPAVSTAGPEPRMLPCE
jgi:Glycosyl transferases group 1/Glycosyltransferase Family 4